MFYFIRSPIVFYINGENMTMTDPLRIKVHLSARDVNLGLIQSVTIFLFINIFSLIFLGLDVQWKLCYFTACGVLRSLQSNCPDDAL